MHLSDRSLTNFSVWFVPRSSSISSTSPLSFIRMVTPQLAHDRDWCQRRDELLSSVCRHGLLEDQESHHSVHTHDSARKSRNCTTSAVPIPPHVAIMLVGVTSTGTRPCRLRSRSHHRRAADDPTTGCCAPVSVKPRAGPRIKPINSGCFGSELHPQQSWKHHRTTCKTTNYATVQKASPGKKKFLAADWRVSFGAGF